MSFRRHLCMATYNMRLCEAHYSCADVTGAAVSGLECHGSICNRALIRAEASVACSATGTSTRVVAPATRAENRVQKEILRMRRKAKQGPRKIFAYERQREIRAQKKKAFAELDATTMTPPAVAERCGAKKTVLPCCIKLHVAPGECCGKQRNSKLMP